MGHYPPVLAWGFISTLFVMSGLSAQKNDSLLNAKSQAKEICMDELGCFSITDDFVSLVHRPINVLPHDRASIGTRCLLYTRENCKESHPLEARVEKTFTESHFDAKNPTKIIVHGFMDNKLYGPWMGAMKDELLMHGDYNVIVVDWSAGNRPPYFQATANTRVVAAEIVHIVRALEKFKGAKREDFHIIGHSLGAHIAGYVGEGLKTIGRITGCDPAMPYFQNMPVSVRLDPTDADYVDVIHTDATDILFIGLGMSHLVGHVDFFPNNGRNQPGCETDKFTAFFKNGVREGTRRLVSCNHQRALDFFHHSINYRKILPLGYECESYKDFTSGKCSECGQGTKKCAILGIRADEYKQFRDNSIQRKMYLETSGKPPFWLYHYQISIKLHKKRPFSNDVRGTLDITLFGSKQDELFHVQTSARQFHPGAVYNFLGTTDKDLGEIKSASFQWKNSLSFNILNLLQKFLMYVEYITVIPMNVIETSPRNMTNRIFCEEAVKGIASNSISLLYQDNACLKHL